MESAPSHQNLMVASSFVATKAPMKVSGRYFQSQNVGFTLVKVKEDQDFGSTSIKIPVHQTTMEINLCVKICMLNFK